MLQAELTSQLFAESPPGAAMRREVAQLTRSALARARADDANDGPPLVLLAAGAGARPGASWGLQFRVHCWRCWLSLTRDAARLRDGAAAAFLLSLMVGSLFYRLDRPRPRGHEGHDDDDDQGGYPALYDQTDVLDVSGALFLIGGLCCFLQCHSSLRTLPPWFLVFLRDRGTGAGGGGGSGGSGGRVDAFYLAASLVEVPLHVATPLAVVAVDYWMVGLGRGHGGGVGGGGGVAGFFVAAGVVVLSANAAASFGHLVAAAREGGGGGGGGMSVAGLAMLPLLLLAGFLLNDGSVPAWLSWARYLSWFRHAHELLMVNQWSGVAAVSCPGGGGVGGGGGGGVGGDDTATANYSVVNNSSSSSSIDNSSGVVDSFSNSSGGAGGCLFGSGRDVLQQFHFSADNSARNWVLLAACLLAFRAAAFLSLLARARRSQA